MRSALCVLPMLVALTACRPSAPVEATFTSADEAAVRKNLDDYAPLTIAKNWDGIVTLYTSDAVRFAPNEPPVQHDAMKAWFEKFPPISALEAPTDHLDGSGNLAVATGHYALTATVPGQTTPMSDKGKWFVILKKQADGSWKRTADGWNSDNPPPKS